MNRRLDATSKSPKMLAIQGRRQTDAAAGADGMKTQFVSSQRRPHGRTQAFIPVSPKNFYTPGSYERAGRSKSLRSHERS